MKAPLFTAASTSLCQRNPTCWRSATFSCCAYKESARYNWGIATVPNRLYILSGD